MGPLKVKAIKRQKEKINLFHFSPFNGKSYDHLVRTRHCNPASMSCVQIWAEYQIYNFYASNNIQESYYKIQTTYTRWNHSHVSHYTSIFLFFYTHPSLSRKILQLSTLNQIYEERTQATIYTSSYSSKALILYEIRRVSIEVQEYRSRVRNDGND